MILKNISCGCNVVQTHVRASYAVIGKIAIKLPKKVLEMQHIFIMFLQHIKMCDVHQATS